MQSNDIQYNDLRLFLSGTVSPERQDILLDAAQTLTDIGIFSHELAITNALDLITMADNSVTIATIESVLITTMLDLLYQNGISVNDTPTGVMLDLVKAVYAFDNYGDPIAVLDICQAQQEPEETLAEVFSLLTKYQPEELLPHFAEVKPSLITRITDISKENELNLIPQTDSESDAMVALDVRGISIRLKSFLEKYPSLIVKTKVCEGTPIGLDYHEYLEQNWETLIDLPSTQLVVELYGFAVASNLPVENFHDSVYESLHELIADHSALLAAETVLNSQLKGAVSV